MKKSRAIHDQGRSTTYRQTNGAWVTSRGRLGAWRGSGTTERISALAVINQPPSDPAGFTAVLGFVLGLILAISLLFFGNLEFGASLLFFLGFPSGFAFCGYKIGKSNDKGQYDSDVAEYNRQWYCMKCGIKFLDQQEKSLQLADRAVSHFSASPALRVGAGRTQFESGPLRQDYADRVRNPVQRAKQETNRDSSGLIAIAERSTSKYEFDPNNPYALDLGIVSRLSSLGYLAWDDCSDTFSISELGQSRLISLS